MNNEVKRFEYDKVLGMKESDSGFFVQYTDYLILLEKLQKVEELAQAIKPGEKSANWSDEDVVYQAVAELIEEALI